MSLTTRIMGFAVCLLLLGLISFYMWREYNRPEQVYYDPVSLGYSAEQEPESLPEPPPEPPPEPETYYPAGLFLDTPERKTYADGDLTLRIPRMNLEGPVLNGVTDEILAKGVGLFDQAQLPGMMEHNSNTSIAGHRDIFGEEFYDIDKLVEGDEIILTYMGKTYTYIVEQSFVTSEDDWEPIKVREYPCVTLQSCTPIGKAIDRIFVVGRLSSITAEGDMGSVGQQESSAPPPAGQLATGYGQANTYIMVNESDTIAPKR